MLCGGITVFSPLKKNGCGPGKTVGIVGVGGLGHFGVLFARALGADKVLGISRKASKRDEVLQLGADSYIATDDDADWAKKSARSLDLIVSTVSSAKMPLTEYLGLLKVGGTFIQVGYVLSDSHPRACLGSHFQLNRRLSGASSCLLLPLFRVASWLTWSCSAPDNGELPPINAFTLLTSGIKVGGSGIGSPAEIKEMLDLAAAQNVRPWVQLRPLKDANQAILDMEEGKARFRYVLVNEKHT